MLIKDVVQIDNFIDDFESFNEHIRNADFTGMVNPDDGVEYPDISVDIPEDVLEEYKWKLEMAMNSKVKINYLFLRNTDSTTETAPNQAHTDTRQGTHIALLYMQDGPEGAGTQLVRHKGTGMDSDPRTERELEIWQRDKNDYDKWDVIGLIEMKENRLVCGIWSAAMHRAVPVGGFGTSPKDGRIVLICFYELVP